MTGEGIILYYNRLNGNPIRVSRLKAFHASTQAWLDSTGTGEHVKHVKGIYERLTKLIKRANGYHVIDRIELTPIKLKKKVTPLPKAEPEKSLNGNRIEVGEITPDQAKAIKHPAGKIYISKEGLAHIEKRKSLVKKLTGLDILDFVKVICFNFTEIREGDHGALLLILRTKGSKIAVVRVSEKDYTVYSAYPSNRRYVEKRKLLWSQASLSVDAKSSLGSAVIPGGPHKEETHRKNGRSHNSFQKAKIKLLSWLNQNEVIGTTTRRKKAVKKKKATIHKGVTKGPKAPTTPPPAKGPKVPKKVKALYGVMTGADIAGLSFRKLELTGRYKQDFLKMYNDTQVMIWGAPGSGKTVYTLELAQYMAEVLGLKVAYIAREEMGRSTFTEKIQNFKIGDPKLVFAKNLDLLKDAGYEIEDFDAIFLDSVNAMGWTLEFYKKFAEQHPKALKILVVQSTKDGDFRGGKDWEHEMDIAGEVVNRKMILRKNRLDPEFARKADKLWIAEEVKEKKRAKEIRRIVNGKEKEPEEQKAA